MAFGENLINARMALNLSQKELAEKANVTERSIYNYEQTESLPRAAIIKRLAEALDVTVAYLMDDDDASTKTNVDAEHFIATAKKEYGPKGAQEAQDVLDKALALFAGGELDENAKEIFFQSIMEVYLESKAEAREKYAPKRRKSRKA